MGARQTFPLQPVLDFKSSLVDMLEMEFARLKMAYQNEMDALLALTEAENQEMEMLLWQQKASLLDCEDIRLRQAYLHVLADDKACQTSRVQEAQARMETKRQELVQKMKDQKVLEKLHERHQAEQAREGLRREGRVIDDLVTTRYKHQVTNIK